MSKETYDIRTYDAPSALEHVTLRISLMACVRASIMLTWASMLPLISLRTPRFALALRPAYARMQAFHQKHSIARRPRSSAIMPAGRKSERPDETGGSIKEVNLHMTTPWWTTQKSVLLYCLPGTGRQQGLRVEG